MNLHPYKLTLHISQSPQHIVKVGQYHQDDEDGNACILGTYHEFFTGFAPCYHLVEQEKHMATIESGYGENVHKGENDAKEGRHEPEHVPIPHWGEEAANGSKATQRLGTIGREQLFHVANIAFKHLHTISCTSWEAFEEPIFYMRFLVFG